MSCPRVSVPSAAALLASLLLSAALPAPALSLAVPPPAIIAPTGAATGDLFGCSVAAAGDMNGDGYMDVIVGAMKNDAAGTDAGAAYVFLGGPAADEVADVVMVGEAARDSLGYSVAAAGDVNGDGYADVIVGAPMNDTWGTSRGRAYVYFGGTVVDGVADLTLTGTSVGGTFGCAVSGAGDVNGDGYGDLIVGEKGNDAGGVDAGLVRVFFGGASPDATVDLLVIGATAHDGFGTTVAAAGDMNGDGYDDMIVGAPDNDAGGTNAGRVYVYFGGPVPDAVADLTMTGPAAGNRFGTSIACAGDVNGDGYEDVIIGDPGNDAGWTDAGAAHVYYGGASPDALADITLVEPAGGSYFGCSVAAAGDVNADGFGDLIVGEYLYGGAGAGAGGAVLYYGGATRDAVPDGRLLGGAAGDWLGGSVGAAGDFNGDGVPDVLVGACGSDVAGANAGRAYVYDLRPPFAACRLDRTMLGLSYGDGLGRSVGTAGDVNGDGYVDLIVGAHQAGTYSTGAAYVYYGGPDADSHIDLVLEGLTAGGHFGESVGTAGDVNGDGYADVVVGAPSYALGGGTEGQAFVFFGGADPDAVADLMLTGEGHDNYFGSSVGTAGDVNGDGYADVIVGAEYASAGGAGAGRAYVYFGGPAADTLADWTMTGTTGWALGASVGTAGDVNGDGYDDVIVGAPDTDKGTACVYLGAPSPDAVADLVLGGQSNGDEFGGSVGTAGDVNRDGYADVIVGAMRNDAGGADAGRAYVYYGGSSPDATADLTVTGGSAYAYFGHSVGAAGDVNDDGYADVIVGAAFTDAAGTDAGQACVFYGGWAADGVADHVMSGGAANEYLGWSVGAAGDPNGDGFDDVVVGAPGNSDGATFAGAAYVHDFNRFLLTSPNGGETWTRNAMESVTWLGAERANLEISADGGVTWAPVASAVGGAESNSVAVVTPDMVTDLARVRLTPCDSWIAGSDMSDSVFTVQATTGVEPGDLALRFRAPWPNPSSGLVRLGLELARPSVVTVTVLDVAGREVARPITAERFEAGKIEREWRPNGLAPGVYTVRAKVGELKLTRRLVWLGGR